MREPNIKITFIKYFDKLFGLLFFKTYKIAKLRSFIHKIYFLMFKFNILNCPNKLIYDINRYPPTFGDYIHVISIAHSLSLKFNNKNLKEIIIIFDDNNISHSKFIKNVAFNIREILNFRIKISKLTYKEIHNKNLDLGFSIYPYMPTFYFLNSSVRNHKPIDIPIIAKYLDLRIFSEVKIDKFKVSKYEDIFLKLQHLTKSKYYCFVLREENSKNLFKKEGFNSFAQKKWNSSNTQSVIKKLINEKKNVLIINPLNQKYSFEGAITFNEATEDILLRYFLYINAYQVIAVESGTCSLLIHSKNTKYLIYDKVNICEGIDINFLNRNNFSLTKDFILDSPSRKIKIGNLESSDILD